MPAFPDHGIDDEISRRWTDQQQRSTQSVHHLANAMEKERAGPSSSSQSFWAGITSRPAGLQKPDIGSNAPRGPPVPLHYPSPISSKLRMNSRGGKEPKASAARVESLSHDRYVPHMTDGAPTPMLHRSETTPNPRTSSRKYTAYPKSSDRGPTETNGLDYRFFEPSQMPDKREGSPVRQPNRPKSRHQVVSSDSDDGPPVRSGGAFHYGPPPAHYQRFETSSPHDSGEYLHYFASQDTPMKREQPRRKLYRPPEAGIY